MDVWELDRRAEAAFAAMAAHWPDCVWCELVGAELAPLDALCPEGRERRQAWEEAERELHAGVPA